MLHRDDIYTIGHPAMDGVFQPFIDYALKYTGDNIIDIGCGYGNYSKELVRLGKKVEGLEYNKDYAKKAGQNGITCHVGDARKTKFKDNQFESAVLFEVLEHIKHPEEVVKEALRITSKNVVITVPNSNDLERLKHRNLTYYHMITDDHVNFFSISDFEKIASDNNAKVTIIPSEPTEYFELLEEGSLVHKIMRRARRHNLIGPLSHYRLYVIFESTS